MVRLYEYQGKELFRKKGIKTPKGSVAKTPEEARKIAEEIGGKTVLKPQILAGGRGLAGAIKFAESPAEAEKAARELFGMEVRGFPVKEILVEEFVPHEKSYYLSVLSYHGERKPVCIVSSMGGVEIEEVAEKHPEYIVKYPVNILKGLKTYEAYNVVRKLPNVSSGEVRAVGDVLKRLYDVYRGYDCKLAEINPLALTSKGEAIALDARVQIDDDAVYRHPELGLAAVEEAGRPETELEVIAGKINMEDPRGVLHFVQSDPDGSYSKQINAVPVGFYSTGTGSTLTSIDELAKRGYFAVNTTDTALVPASKIYKLTKVILSQPHIEGFVFISPHSSQQLLLYARGMIKALKELYPETGGKPNIPMVFCFRGGWDKEAVELFKKHGIADSPLVKVLWRVTEAEAAEEFDKLYRRWKQNVK